MRAGAVGSVTRRAGIKRSAGRAGLLPGQADVTGEVAGEAELKVAGDDRPSPPVGGGRVAQLGPRPNLKNLNVFEIEAAQELLPSAADLLGGGARG